MPEKPVNPRDLVAPELRALADSFPLIELNAEVLATSRQNPIRDTAWLPPMTAEQLAVDFREVWIPGPVGAPDVRVVVYTPAGTPAEPRPAILHLHGGGFVRGLPEMMDGGNRALAVELDCVIVSVDYRLAPETPWPGALEDCYAALGWLHKQAAELGVDAGRIAIKGESAGAYYAAALAIHARDRDEYPVCLQVLDSPPLDDRTGSSAEPHPYCGTFVWSPASNRFAWRALLGREPGGSDIPAEAVPARAADLGGLPPAFIIVGGLDLFFEENLEYARRLTRAGVPTELHVIAGAFHGYQAASRDAPQVWAYLTLTRNALARAFGQWS